MLLPDTRGQMYAVHIFLFSKNFFFLAAGYNLNASTTIAPVKCFSKNTVLEYKNLGKYFFNNSSKQVSAITLLFPTRAVCCFYVYVS